MCIAISNTEGCSTVWVDDVVEGAGRVAGGWGTFIAYGLVQSIIRRSKSRGSLPCQGLPLLTVGELHTNGRNTSETVPLVRSVKICASSQALTCHRSSLADQMYHCSE